MKSLRIRKGSKKLYYFLIIYFFWSGADIIYAYLAPIIVEEFVSNEVILGALLSLGAVAGMVVDLLADWKYHNKKYSFFYNVGIASGFILLILLYFKSVFLLPFIVIFGGVFFEIMTFGDEEYAASQLEKKLLMKVYGFIMLLATVSSIFIPIALEPFLIKSSYTEPIFLYFIFVGLAFFVMLLRRKNLDNGIGQKDKPGFTHRKLTHMSLRSELKVWKIIFKRTKSIIILLILVQLIEAFFWTLGPLIAVQYYSDSTLSELFIPFYVLPGLIIGLVISKLTTRFNKIKLLYTTSILGGVGLSLFGLVENIEYVLILTLISSIFIATAHIIVEGLLLGLINLLHDDENYLIGLRGFATDLGYLFGPFLAGVFAAKVGLIDSFAWLGIFTAVTSILVLIFLSGDIRLPHKEIAEIESNG